MTAEQAFGIAFGIGFGLPAGIGFAVFIFALLGVDLPEIVRYMLGGRCPDKERK